MLYGFSQVIRYHLVWDSSSNPKSCRVGSWENNPHEHLEQLPGVSHYGGRLPAKQLPSCNTRAQSLDIVGSKKLVKYLQLVVGMIDVGVQWPQLVHLHSGQVVQRKIDGGEKYIGWTYPGKYHVMMLLLLTMRFACMCYPTFASSTDFCSFCRDVFRALMWGLTSAMIAVTTEALLSWSNKKRNVAGDQILN